MEQLFSHGEIILTTFAFCVASGFVPVLNAEAYLIAASLTSSPTVLLPLILAATAGQMTAKSHMYMAGRGVIALPLGRYRARLDTAGQRIQAARLGPGPFIGFSGFTGVPPFYATSIVAGVLKLPFFAVFLAPGMTGRLLRFTVVAVFPQVVKSLIS